MHVPIVLVQEYHHYGQRSCLRPYKTKQAQSYQQSDSVCGLMAKWFSPNHEVWVRLPTCVRTQWFRPLGWGTTCGQFSRKRHNTLWLRFALIIQLRAQVVCGETGDNFFFKKIYVSMRLSRDISLHTMRYR